MLETYWTDNSENAWTMRDKSTKITDFDIQALVDEALDYEEAKRVRAQLATDAQARRRYEELKAQKTALLRWWQSLS